MDFKEAREYDVTRRLIPTNKIHLPIILSHVQPNLLGMRVYLQKIHHSPGAHSEGPMQQ